MISRGWFRLNEAAGYVGISSRTLHEWLNNGLRWSKVGGCKLIKRENIDAYLESFEQRADVDKIVDSVIEEMKL